MIKTKFFISPLLESENKHIVELRTDDILAVDNLELRNATRIEIYENQLESGKNAALIYDGDFEIGRFATWEQIVIMQHSRILTGENLEPKGRYIMMFGKDRI